MYQSRMDSAAVIRYDAASKGDSFAREYRREVDVEAFFQHDGDGPDGIESREDQSTPCERSSRECRKLSGPCHPSSDPDASDEADQPKGDQESESQERHPD